jgi:hypothetical protein
VETRFRGDFRLIALQQKMNVYEGINLMGFNIAEMRQRAEEGDCPSQCMLGLCYLYGIDIEVDYKEAFGFLSAAAEQHASRAVLNLGRMYAQGLGIEQNFPEAIRHFEAVAKLPDSGDTFQARVELGRLFGGVSGVPVDPKLVLKWYSAAVEIASEGDDPEEVKEARDYIEGTSKLH